MLRSETIKKLDDLKGEYVASFWKLCDDGKLHKVFMSNDSREQLLRHSFRKDFVIYTQSQYSELYAKKSGKKVVRKISTVRRDSDKPKKIINGSGYKLSQYFPTKIIKEVLGEYDKEINRNYGYSQKDLSLVYTQAKKSDVKIKREIEVTQIISKIRG